MFTKDSFIRVNTNVLAMQGVRSLTTVARARENTYAQLNTGERINRAADDAAGLAISEKMKAEIRSSQQANRNAGDGISLVQVAEGGLMESSNILIRMRELAIQAASDTIGHEERPLINLEYQSLKNEIDRISKATEFNGHKLLDGTGKALEFQVGSRADTTKNRIGLNLGALDSGAKALGVTNSNLLSKDSARLSLGTIESAQENIVGKRTMLGSLQIRLTSTSQNLAIYDQNLQSSNSQIRDTDYAHATSQLARNKVISDASTAVAVQANSFGKEVLDLV